MRLKLLIIGFGVALSHERVIVWDSQFLKKQSSVPEDIGLIFVHKGIGDSMVSHVWRIAGKTTVIAADSGQKLIAELKNGVLCADFQELAKDLETVLPQPQVRPNIAYPPKTVSGFSQLTPAQRLGCLGLRRLKRS